MHPPTYRIAHTTAFVIPVVEHWLEREIAQWVHPMKDRSDDTSHHERTLLPRSYISLPEREGRKEMFYLTTHSTHLLIYGYIASDIWQRTIQIAREETRGRHYIRIAHTRAYVTPVVERETCQTFTHNII